MEKEIEKVMSYCDLQFAKIKKEFTEELNAQYAFNNDTRSKYDAYVKDHHAAVVEEMQSRREQVIEFKKHQLAVEQYLENFNILMQKLIDKI